MTSIEKDLRTRLRDIQNAWDAYRLEQRAIETSLVALTAERLKGKCFRLKSYNEGQFAKVIERDTVDQQGFKCIVINTGAHTEGQEIFVRFGWLSVRELDDPESADEVEENSFLNARDRVLDSMAKKISEITNGSANSGEIILREREKS